MKAKTLFWVGIYLLAVGVPVASFAQVGVLIASNPQIWTSQSVPVSAGSTLSFGNGTSIVVQSDGLLTCSWVGCTFTPTVHGANS